MTAIVSGNPTTKRLLDFFKGSREKGIEGKKALLAEIRALSDADRDELVRLLPEG